MDVENTLKSFFKLKEIVNNTNDYIGFTTENGRRLIRPYLGINGKEWVVLDNKLSVIEGVDEQFKSPNPFEIILGYFTSGDVPIKELFLFKSIQEATEWLFNKTKKETSC